MLISELCERAKNMVTDLDPDEKDELIHFRVRSKTNEISVAPHNDFILIVVQNLVEGKTFSS